jgi:hypothetical protein
VQTVCETLSQKNPSQKRVGGVAQGEGPEFKPQHCKKRKKEVLYVFMLTVEIRTDIKSKFNPGRLQPE